MAFNPKMFKQKKKREVDPNAPPRPNLLSQDKKLREQTAAMDRLVGIVERQQTQLEDIERKYKNLQISVSQLIDYVRKNSK